MQEARPLGAGGELLSEWRGLRAARRLQEAAAGRKRGGAGGREEAGRRTKMSGPGVLGLSEAAARALDVVQGNRGIWSITFLERVRVGGGLNVRSLHACLHAGTHAAGIRRRLP